LFLDDPDEIETNRSQSLIGLNLFPPSRADTRAPHKPRSIAEPLIVLQSESISGSGTSFDFNPILSLWLPMEHGRLSSASGR
jgi:hypothetical protein